VLPNWGHGLSKDAAYTQMFMVGTSHLLPVGLLSSAAAPETGPEVAADGPAPAPTAPVPPLLPLAHAPYPRPPGPSEMFSESTGR